MHAFVREGRPFVWAHRGASRDAPENTLAAFSLAKAQGADGFELDAQRCQTGEVVVLHDETLGRTLGATGLLREVSFCALRGLDAGSWKDPRFRGERVPLLAEALELARDLGLAVNVELKCDQVDDGGLTQAALAEIARCGAEQRVLLSSFNPRCLLEARVRAPKLPRALLFEAGQGFPLRGGHLWRAVGAQAMHPDRILASARAVRRWRARGLSVAPWTVDDPQEAEALCAAGATGLITNVPALMVGIRTAD